MKVQCFVKLFKRSFNSSISVDKHNTKNCVILSISERVDGNRVEIVLFYLGPGMAGTKVINKMKPLVEDSLM